MIDFLPFRPYHLQGFNLQGMQQRYQADLYRPEVAEALDQGLAYSAVIDKRLVASAGIVPLHAGRAQAWALLAPLPPWAWVTLTRKVIQVLDAGHESGFWRIETAVLAEFGHGHRWAKMLGFTAEGMMRRYGPDGADHMLYARIDEREIDYGA